MNRKTLRALKDSIEKWRQIECGEMADTGDNCMLCAKFFNAGCRGCPVMAKTGQSRCCGSPYDQWRAAQAANFVDIWIADTHKLVRIARAERKFLESLLPKEKP